MAASACQKTLYKGAEEVALYTDIKNKQSQNKKIWHVFETIKIILLLLMLIFILFFTYDVFCFCFLCSLYTADNLCCILSIK